MPDLAGDLTLTVHFPGTANTEEQTIEAISAIYLTKDLTAELQAIADDVTSRVNYQSEVAPSAVAVSTYLRTVEHIAPEQVTPNCGNGVIDATAAIQAIGALGGVARFTKGGIYKITSPLVLNPARPLQWVFEEGANIDARSLASSTLALRIGSDARQAASFSLTNDAGIGDLSIRCANASALTQGTLLRVCSNALYDPGRTNSRIGELVFVDGVDTTTTPHTVFLLTPLRDSYLVSDSARAHVITPQYSTVLENLGLLGNEGTELALTNCGGVTVEYAVGARMIAPRIQGFGNWSIRFQDVFGGRIEDAITEQDLPTLVTGYGISVMGASQDIIVDGHQAFGNRHGFTTNNTSVAGREGVVGTVTYRNAAIYGTRRASGGSKAGGDAIDTHAAVRFFRAENCSVYDSTLAGVNIEGPSAELRNLRLLSAQSRGIRIANCTTRDGRYSITDCYVASADSDAVRITQGFPLSGTPATGKVLSIDIAGLKAEGYVSKLFYFQNLGATAETRINLTRIFGDAATSTDTNGQVYIMAAQSLSVSPGQIVNIPHNGTGVYLIDVAAVNGPDLGFVSFRSGTDSSGNGFRFGTSSSVAMTGRVRGTTVATTTNTARGFRIDPGVTGLTVEAAQGNASIGGATVIPALPKLAMGAGRYYSTYDASVASTVVVPAVGTLYLYPFEIRGGAIVNGLHIRIAGTAGTASNVKLAVYAHGSNGQPVGAPLIETGSIATTTPSVFAGQTLGSPVELSDGWYWAAQKHEGSPLPMAISILGTSGLRMASLIGAISQSASLSTSAVVALSMASTFATAMPTISSGQSFSNVTTSGVPIVQLEL